MCKEVNEGECKIRISMHVMYSQRKPNNIIDAHDVRKNSLLQRNNNLKANATIVDKNCQLKYNRDGMRNGMIALMIDQNNTPLNRIITSCK